MNKIFYLLFILLFFTNQLFSNTKTLKIAISTDMKPYSFVDKNGHNKGIFIDYWNLWSKKTGLKIEFVASTWNENLEKMKTKNVDIHSGLFKNKKREQYLEYLNKIYYTKSNIYTFKNKNIKELKDLTNLNLGLVKGTFYEDFFSNYFPKIKLKTFNTYNDLNQAIKNEKITSFIDDDLLLWTNTIRYFDYNAVDKIKNFELKNWFYAAIKKNNKKLKKIVLEGMEQISKEEVLKIEEKWVSNKNLRYLEQHKNNTILNEEEVNYLNTKTKINIATVNTWKYFSYLDANKKLIGFHQDIIKIINQNLGTRFATKAFNSWENAYNSVLKDSSDGIFALSWSKKREEIFSYSPAYYFTPFKIIVRNKNENIKNIKDFNYKKVAYLNKSIINSTIKRLAPNSIISSYKNKKDIFLALKNKDIDVTLIGAINEEELKEYGLKNIKDIYVKEGELYIGSKKKNKILSSIVKKAILSISKSQMQVLIKKWFNKKKSSIFTKEELNYINKSSFIKVGVNNYKPISFIKDGKKFDGIAGDIFKKISTLSGLKFEVFSDDWHILLEKLKNKELDILPTVVQNKKRDNFALFTQKYINYSSSLFVKENNMSIKSFKELNGKKLAIEKSDAVLNIIKEKFPKIKIIETKNLLESIKLLQNNEVSAFFELEIIAKNKIKEALVNNIKTIYQDDIKSLGLKIASRKDDLILHQILKKSLFAISDIEKNEILSKYINIPEFKSSSILNFTKAELLYIKNNPILKYAETSWKPFVFINEKGYDDGLLSDYKREITKKTSLKFKHIKQKKWSDVINSFDKKELDILLSYNEDEADKKRGLLSKKFESFNYVIVSNKNATFTDHISELKGKTLALRENFSLYKKIKKNYPNIKIILVDTEEEALEKILKNTADATIMHYAIATYNIQNYYSNLKIAGVLDDKYTHHFLVKKDNQVLNSILNKVIDSIPLDQKLKIREKWIHTNINTSIDYRILYYILSIFLVISLLVIFFIRKLKLANKEIEEEKKKFETLFLDTQDGVILSKNGKYIDVNNAVLELFKCKNKEDFLKNEPGTMSPIYQNNMQRSTDVMKEKLQQCYKKRYYKI